MSLKDLVSKSKLVERAYIAICENFINGRGSSEVSMLVQGSWMIFWDRSLNWENGE